MNDQIGSSGGESGADRQAQIWKLKYVPCRVCEEYGSAQVHGRQHVVPPRAV